MNKFEQLIEYVINDDEQKARALFHDIVVSKSREIYENIMAEEAMEEEVEESTNKEKVEEEVEESLDESMEEDIEEDMGGDAADKLIDEVEVEEESGMNMEDEEEDSGDLPADDGEEHADIAGDDAGGNEPATKDDILDLEGKLDQLMAEFEQLMASDEDMADMGDEDMADMGGDAAEVDDTAEMGMMEGISLKAAPKPVTSEEGSVNKKSTVAANAGAKTPIGSAVKPVHATGTEAKGRPAPTAKDLGATPTQEAGARAFKSAAPAPVKTQASGVNTKSVIPSKHN